MHPKFNETLTEALGILTSRQEYAAAVLRGHQRWSGADLRGKARRYGASYARQRAKAADAWCMSGGEILRRRIDGKLVSAVEIAIDDYGNRVYATRSRIEPASEFRGVK